MNTKQGQREVCLGMEKGTRMAKYIISFKPQNNPVVRSTLQMRKVRPGMVKCYIQGCRCRLDRPLTMPRSEVDGLFWVFCLFGFCLFFCFLGFFFFFKTRLCPSCQLWGSGWVLSRTPLVEFWSCHFLATWPWVSYLILGLGSIINKMGVIQKEWLLQEKVVKHLEVL